MNADPITLADFQSRARPVKPVPPNPLWPALALGGEAGELLNVRKKIERDAHYYAEDANALAGRIPALDQALLEEAGDTLFYLRLALLERGFTLEDAATACLEKLQEKRIWEEPPKFKVNDVVIVRGVGRVLVMRGAARHEPTDEYPDGYWQYALSLDGTAVQALDGNPYKEDELRLAPNP